MSASPRALLVSLRDPHDAMVAHERMCFAERARIEIDALDIHYMVGGRPSVAQLRGYDAIFFGGSGAYSVLDDVPWIRASVEVLLEVVALRVPAWASCFGFQGLARALGGEVIRDDSRTEMGSVELTLTDEGTDDPLMSALPMRFWAQEGHHDYVSRLPEGVILLARGDRVEAQAFRVEGAPFWASQFHPELTLERTLDRFRHYRDHYIDPVEGDRILAELEGGLETDEVGELLPRLVRGEFSLER